MHPRAILLVAGMSLTGCGFASTCTRTPDPAGLPTCPITASYIANLPESHLLYPGGHLVSTKGEDEMRGIDGSSDAQVTVVYTVDASPDAVVAWYDGRLRAAGWGLVAGSSLTPQGAQWTRRGREAFTLTPAARLGGGLTVTFVDAIIAAP